MGRIANEPVESIKLDEVTIDEIYVDPSQNMRRFPPPAKDIQELASDIADKGQLQPVVVRPISGEGTNGYKYSLVAGFQRVMAIQSLLDSGTKLKVLVRVVDAEDLGALLANVSENARRSNTSIIDLSYAIGKLKDGDSSKDDNGTITVVRPAMMLKDIAVSLGLSAGNVSEIDKMRNLRVPIQKKIHTGEITKDLARQLVKMTEEEQDTVLEKLEAGESAAVLVQAVKGGKTRAGKRKVRAEAAEEDGSGKTVKRSLSTKAALLIMKELTAKPVVEEGEEEPELTSEDEISIGVLKCFTRFLEGKIGAKALINQIKALV